MRKSTTRKDFSRRLFLVFEPVCPRVQSTSSSDWVEYLQNLALSQSFKCPPNFKHCLGTHSRRRGRVSAHNACTCTCMHIFVRVFFVGIDCANRLTNKRGQSQCGKKRKRVCVLIPSFLVDRFKGLDGKVLKDFGGKLKNPNQIVRSYIRGISLGMQYAACLANSLAGCHVLHCRWQLRDKARVL